MPTLGNALDFAQLEGRQFRAHVLGAAPSSPVTGQLYYNSGNNTLWYWDGSIWQTAKGGSAYGTAGGDLSGTYPNPQIAAGAIVDADVNAAAAIAKSKLAALAIVNADVAAGAAIAYAKLALTGAVLNGDIAAAAGIVYSKLNLSASIVNADIAAAAGIALSKLAVDPLARANHTGTQLAATISDFNTARDLQRLDQHAAPTADVSLNNRKITNLADPTQDQDVVNKRYADNIAQGLSQKNACRMASTANVLIPGPTTSFSIDGVALANGDRVLLKNQTNATENGVYTWTLGVGMARAGDMDSVPEFPNAYVWVNEGTVNADTAWVCTNDISMVLGTTGVTWVQFASAGAAIAGAGLGKTGNTIDVNVDNSSIEINSDILRVKALGIVAAMLADNSINLAGSKITGTLPVPNGGTGGGTPQLARIGLNAAGIYSSATHAAGTTISILQSTHLLGQRVIVQVQHDATGAVELPDVTININGDVTVTYGASVAANSKRVTVLG